MKCFEQRKKCTHESIDWSAYPPQCRDCYKSFKQKKPNYEKGFNILMEYFDYIPEEDRQDVSDKLEKLGL